jgi:hypothetical protein
LCALIARIAEKTSCFSVLNDVAFEHEGSFVASALGLLHVVGHENDGNLAFKLFNQLLELRGAQWVKG